jgi:hypothetical protein
MEGEQVMKEMCFPCYGTGQIRCLACGGTGVMPNISLLGEDCLKCKGTGKGRCQLCRGSGFTGGDFVQDQVSESQVQWSMPLAALPHP